MAKNIKIKAGNTTIDMSGEIGSIADDLVNKLLPETRRSLDKELSRIEEEARDRWLVREENSKNSRDKLYVELAITPNFELIGIVGNKAEYAWAIKVGKDAQGSRLSEGKRLSNELLFKPVKKSSDKIASTLANEITKQIK